MKLDVLYEDNHLLAVSKPAGLATMGLPEGEPTLLEEARQYIKRKYNKPGNVYLGIVSRLDAPVTGVVLIARTSKAAARLTEQFKKHSVEKTYWALVSGSIRPSEGQCIDYLRRDERHRRVHVCSPGDEGAQEARLGYRKLQETELGCLLEVQLETGRKHQIRVQLAKHGHPIIGDRKYGSPIEFPQGIALHSRRLVFEHPTLKERIELTAPLPKCWKPFGVTESSHGPS